MKEHRGVRIGQRVRDVEGNDLGRVDALYAWGFAVVKGFPLLFRDDRVLRYEEVRPSTDGTLRVARAPGDIFTLAAGELPASWKVEAKPGMPSAATPSEGAGVLAGPGKR
jgi:hypothetical protein